MAIIYQVEQMTHIMLAWYYIVHNDIALCIDIQYMLHKLTQAGIQ